MSDGLLDEGLVLGEELELGADELSGLVVDGEVVDGELVEEGELDELSVGLVLDGLLGIVLGVLLGDVVEGDVD